VRILYLMAIIALAMVAAGCSTISVNHDLRFRSGFRDLQYVRVAAGACDGDWRRGGARQQNTLLDKRIRSAVEAELQAKGMTADTRPPLYYCLPTGVDSKINVTDWGTRIHAYGGWYGDRDVDVYQYEEGTLIVDLIDAKTHQLVWRGTATKTLEDNPSPERMEQNLREVVGKMFASYPPSK